MSSNLEIVPVNQWFDKELKAPLVIAGPCSAETETQVYQTAQQLSKIEGVQIFRAGVWKPRTRPGNFEGIGLESLEWIKRVKEDFGFYTSVEVATAKHAELALKNGIDILWLGARTTSNPFSVQEIADFLKGTDVPVMVKNPLNPDLALWVGAIERINKAGIKKIAAVHRGFHPFEHTKYRNIPKWELPISLKSMFHELPIIIDPSHIAGRRNLLFEVAQKGLDLNMDGLMVEVHHQPENALSDKEQQITPSDLSEMLQKLAFRRNIATDEFLNELNQFRNQIDSIDTQIIELLHQRLDIVEKIGHLKCKNDVSILQLSRWEKIMETRLEYGKELNISEEFLTKVLQLVHKESIQRQAEAMEDKKKD